MGLVTSRLLRATSSPKGTTGICAFSELGSGGKQLKGKSTTGGTIGATEPTTQRRAIRHFLRGGHGAESPVPGERQAVQLMLFLWRQLFRMAGLCYRALVTLVTCLGSLCRFSQLGREEDPVPGFLQFTTQPPKS